MAIAQVCFGLGTLKRLKCAIFLVKIIHYSSQKSPLLKEEFVAVASQQCVTLKRLVVLMLFLSGQNAHLIHVMHNSHIQT